MSALGARRARHWLVQEVVDAVPPSLLPPEKFALLGGWIEPSLRALRPLGADLLNHLSTTDIG